MTHARAPWKVSRTRALVIASFAWCSALASSVHAAQVVIDGPVGSREFGRSVTILPNGNIVVTDPGYDAPGPISNVGAVYLFRPDGSLISTVRGSSAWDRIGTDVLVLTNGNYLILSPGWDNGAVVEAGAVTFASSINGVSGVISPANSLVGGSALDLVGNGVSVVTTLPNGNYVVGSSWWDNGVQANAGAATFGSGTSGISGVVSSANSLVGSTAADQVGRSVTALASGNYVVATVDWDNGAIVDAGAVTFGSGVGGISGEVSAVNSLVGSTNYDQVGGDQTAAITTLANGNYVVSSPKWANATNSFVGAATFGSGTIGISGVVSAANSLVGSRFFDSVGGTVTELANGNYVVSSVVWDYDSIINAGAATFASGTTGISGVISPANSLVGTSAFDSVGTVAALPNGNYVVTSQGWDNGLSADVGAATFGSGISGITGAISVDNSLVGTTTNDMVGVVRALANSNYVVVSPSWDYGAIVNAGAVTFGSGTGGVSGIVSAANSLVGSTEEDRVGDRVVNLANGNYVVTSPKWDHGAIVDAGAVTFGQGASGISGQVSPSNSLIGSTAEDEVGELVIPLTNGNYVVLSPNWDYGAIANVGAATFGSGTDGISGPIWTDNSLAGSAEQDQVGSVGVARLANGNYVVLSPRWRNGAAVAAGAATFGSGTGGISGVVSPANSLVGSSAGDQVGDEAIPLPNGNYVVRSTRWNNGPIVDAGAMTFGSGTSGVSGVVSPANSLVGSTARDQQPNAVGGLQNGMYIVWNPAWDNGTIVNAGAYTLALADGSVTGAITDTHSVLGVVEGFGSAHIAGYDDFRNQLAVGQRGSNRVVLHRTGLGTAISIASVIPEVSFIGESVAFTATVASSTPPSNGQVTFTASSGESCVDATPTPIPGSAAEFSCAMVFTTGGTSTVIAEYTGSVIHAYSGSAPVAHTTIDELFGDGFELP